jgi:hypothetical protein
VQASETVVCFLKQPVRCRRNYCEDQNLFLIQAKISNVFVWLVLHTNSYPVESLNMTPSSEQCMDRLFATACGNNSESGNVMYIEVFVDILQVH